MMLEIAEKIPDRATGINGLYELKKEINPKRPWRLIEVKVSAKDLRSGTEAITSLLQPRNTIMDFNISAILRFASKGSGVVYERCSEQDRGGGSNYDPHSERPYGIRDPIQTENARYGNPARMKTGVDVKNESVGISNQKKKSKNGDKRMRKGNSKLQAPKRMKEAVVRSHPVAKQGGNVDARSVEDAESPTSCAVGGKHYRRGGVRGW
mmetsp:Transcript_26590/g.64305  ORF Transcript_26590/g.64305 Transcript_26590/m.64305 type:complete len:209 (+) Transcript_26590:202-828(+)